MKTPSITIPISRPRLAFATGATAALLAVCSLPAQVVKPTGTLFWGASGGGGNGAWEDAGAWWAPATGAQHTWVSGTDANSTLTTYNNFIFTGTGRDAADPYVVTTALPFITSSNAAFIENAASRHTLLLDFRDN
jgi:hypothetical protein